MLLTLAENYHQEKEIPIPTLGLDEALAVSESVWETGDGVNTTTINFLKTAARGFSFEGNKTATNFHYAAVDKTGHSISTKKPELCEAVGKGDFQKVISLIAIFEEQQIKKGEYIVLHFDTATNAIPEILFLVFKNHFKIQEKIKNNYEAFKSREKSILVCSYSTFRGLEHPKITVVVDRDIYYMQHYLVETIARCTTDLCVVVLQNSSTLKGIISEWKNKQVTEQRNIEITKDAAEIENFKTELKSTKNGNIINANLSFEYYQKLEKE